MINQSFFVLAFDKKVHGRTTSLTQILPSLLLILLCLFIIDQSNCSIGGYNLVHINLHLVQLFYDHYILLYYNL